MKPITYEDRVYRLLRRRRGWVDGLIIARYGGAYGWRTAISRARRKYRVQIVNRLRKVGQRTVSEYRLGRRAA